MPSQNVGMHCPASANIMPPVSRMDLRRIAERSPRGRAKDQRQHHGGRGEGEGGGQAGQHQGQRGLLMTQRAAEVAVDGAPEEEAVLLGEGAIEAERCAEDLVILLGAFRAHVQRGGIAGEVHHHEHDPRDAEENEQRPREPLGEIRDHIQLLTLMRDPSTCSP